MALKGADYNGCYYATVRAWMTRLGTAELDARAGAVYVDLQTARIYVDAIVPGCTLTVRAMRASHGRGGAMGRRLGAITLQRQSLDRGTMTLSTVLHEIAHVLVDRRTREVRAERRRENKRRRRAGKPTVFHHVPEERAHGEVFCRVYARVLRDVLT
jgi:hypothetical protein